MVFIPPNFTNARFLNVGLFSPFSRISLSAMRAVLFAPHHLLSQAPISATTPFCVLTIIVAINRFRYRPSDHPTLGSGIDLMAQRRLWVQWAWAARQIPLPQVNKPSSARLAIFASQKIRLGSARWRLASRLEPALKPH